MAPAPWFGLKGKAARKTARQSIDALPDGLWTKCPKCNEILFNKELEKNLRVCNKCGYHYRLRASERLAITIDDGTFVEFDAHLAPANPLDFPDYDISIKKDRLKSGLEDAIVTGAGEMGDHKVVIGVADFAFRGGSMGGVVGEKIVRAMEYAIANNLPVIMFTTSGGARMQEGILSLMQMAKTAAACAKVHEAGLPYIVVFADPTTAGVHASYASLGDFIFAEPGALVGFAGARVAQQAGLIHRPDNFQTSEFQLEHGMIDRIVPRREMKSTLIKILDFCAKEDASDGV
ncbi:MAG: acetyl-CoA carboxylase, carboxyltransferase subunit beta [Armatimonadetes bacterium]|nr:acetyl-CoA carboxylase, carboxyltransferase subunit beta [Armatimonadota bacterium]